MAISTLKKESIVSPLGAFYLLLSLIVLCMVLSFWVLLSVDNKYFNTWFSIAAVAIILFFCYLLIRQVKSNVPIQTPDFDGLAQQLELKNKELLGIAKELIRERKNRASSEKAKQIFLVNMSHEIRTPMNGIMGFARLLDGTLILDDQRESLQMIIKSADQLMAILNDILDFSRLEAGDIDFQNKPFPVKDTVHSIYRMMEHGAKCKGLELSYDIPDTLPEVMSGDAIRLGQILLNLTSNAIKFTEKGGVKISLKLLDEQGDRVSVAFNVHDTGIGIPPSKQQKVFDFFEQVNSDTSRRYAGTGLGLSIVKRLVELQGGEVFLDSVLGKGSDFYFTLHFLKVSGKLKREILGAGYSLQQPTILNGKGVKVLIVEDNPINQLLVIKVLENQGYEITVAGNGRIALQAYEKQSFDIILMDLQMPELDGYETTRIIRKMRGKKGGIPIVAMTAHTIKGELEKCVSIGMNDYISKPFNSAELYKKIEMILKKARPGAVSANKP